MEKELDIHAMWQIIVRQWKMIVLITIMATAGSYFYSSYLITPLFSSSTTLIVIRSPETRELVWQDIQISRYLVGTYREIVHSRRVLEIVIANRSLPYSIDEMRSIVDVAAVRDTELINIKVTLPDPEMASNIANEVARVFIDEIVEIMRVENVSVIDEALTPTGAISPRIRFNTGVAFIVALAVSCGLAFLINYLDRTIKDPVEVPEKLNLPVLGIVPKVEGKRLFTLKDPRSPPAEAFKTIRTNLQYTGLEQQMKRILVTGANPACGKSTVAVYLGITIAQTGASVLLVDGDLRKPVLHRFFDIENDPGLSSLIVQNELNITGVMRRSDHQNLMILPSGPIPPYPAEMLASKRMERLVHLFTQKFDYIIFDSPPIMAVTDAAVLATLVDGVIFVLDYGRVKWEEAKEGLEQLHKVQARVIGTVVNAVEKSSSYYDGYHYYTEQSKKIRRKW